MKKLIASLMAIGMMCAASVPTLAEGTTPQPTEITNNSDPKTAPTEVRLEVKPSWTITIPAEVELTTDVSGGLKSGEMDITLSAGAILTAGNKIQVTANSHTLTLKSNEGAGDVELTTELYAKKSGATYTKLSDSDKVVFEKAASDDLSAAVAQPVKWQTTTPATQASKYKGTTTFTVNGEVSAS